MVPAKYYTKYNREATSGILLTQTILLGVERADKFRVGPGIGYGSWIQDRVRVG